MQNVNELRGAVRSNNSISRYSKEEPKLTERLRKSGVRYFTEVAGTKDSRVCCEEIMGGGRRVC